MAKLGMSMVRDQRSDKQIQGQIFILNEVHDIVFHCYTLELPWRKNKNDVSCIPEGMYRVKKRYSNKYKWHFHILDVPGRELILIHEANYVRQLRGCIAVGEARMDIDGDGLIDVTSSVKTKNKLLDLMPEEFTIIISNL